MAENKKSFILYTDLIHEVDHLTDQEKGRLFQHLLEYVNDMNPVMEDRVLLGSWKHIERQLKRDLKKYDEIRERNRENARKRWDATASDRKQSDTKNADNDNDTDNDTGNESPNGDCLKPKKKKGGNPSIEIPSLDEFMDYGKEKKGSLNISDDSFRLKYLSWLENGWKTGGEKPRRIDNWKTTLLNTMKYMQSDSLKTGGAALHEISSAKDDDYPDGLL